LKDQQKAQHFVVLDNRLLLVPVFVVRIAKHHQAVGVFSERSTNLDSARMANGVSIRLNRPGIVGGSHFQK
jgi:hypothetical protein